jgi:hypothetical protein
MDASAPFEFEVTLPTEKSVTTDAGDVIIEGYAADFEVDRQGEAFLPGAFDQALEKATRAEIPLLFEHDNKRQLGVIEELRVDPERGLWARARIAKAQAGTWAEDVVDKVKRGMMKGLSVRGMSKVTITSDGPRIGTIDLAEISVTPVPVQPGALFAVAQKSFAAAEEDIAAGEIEHVEDPTEKALAYFEEKMNTLTAAFEEISKSMHEGDHSQDSSVDEGMLAGLLDRIGLAAKAGNADMLAEIFSMIEWQSEWDGPVDDMTYKGREDLPALLRAVVDVARAAGGKPSADDLRAVLPSKKSLSACEKCDCADCATCDCIDCPCVNCQPTPSKKSAAWQKKEGQNPKGGLNSKGRASLKKQGQNIRPGVKNYSKASVTDKKRWISWALRFYTNPSGPLIGKNGEPTRLALTAAAWGEPVPTTRAAAQAIAAKARKRKAELERQGEYA